MRSGIVSKYCIDAHALLSFEPAEDVILLTYDQATRNSGLIRVLW